MQCAVVVTKVVALFCFLWLGPSSKQHRIDCPHPTRSGIAVRTGGAMSSDAMGNDDDGGWDEVPKKKRGRNRDKTRKQHNPYVEVLDPTSNEPERSTGSAGVSAAAAAAAAAPNDDAYEPFMVVLVGLIGSGKSTFAQTLVASMPSKFCRINQDELKSRPKCERKLKEVLSSTSPHRLCPIIDRCNFDAKQRSTWYRLAEEALFPVSATDADADAALSSTTTVQAPGGPIDPKSQPTNTTPKGIPVDVVVLDLPYEECLKRCERRKGHETIKSPKQAAGILKQLKKQWSPPHHPKNASEKSKYRSLTIVRNEQERKECLLRLLKQAR